METPALPKVALSTVPDVVKPVTSTMPVLVTLRVEDATAKS